MPRNPCITTWESFSPLDKDLTCDVVIVGGGIAGVSCAYHLMKAGHSVAILEKGVVGDGATGGSSGILYYGSGMNYVQARGMYGEQRATLLWKETEQTMKEMIAVIENNKLACGLRKIGGVMLAKDDAQKELLRQEHEGLSALKIPTTMLDSAQVSSRYALQKFHAGLDFTDVAQIDPGIFVTQMCKKFGIPYYESTPMSSYEVVDDHVVVKTPKGVVHAQHIVIATNMNPLFGLEKHWKMEGSVIMTSQELTLDTQRKIWPRESIIWTMEDEYDIIYPHYERGILELYRFKDVDAKIAYYYNGISYKVDKRWGGTWAKTTDWMPLVGTVSPRVHVCVAMGDQGIVMGWTSGRKMPLVIGATGGKNDELLGMMRVDRFN